MGYLESFLHLLLFILPVPPPPSSAGHGPEPAPLLEDLKGPGTWKQSLRSYLVTQQCSQGSEARHRAGSPLSSRSDSTAHPRSPPLPSTGLLKESRAMAVARRAPPCLHLPWLVHPE